MAGIWARRLTISNPQLLSVTATLGGFINNRVKPGKERPLKEAVEELTHRL